MISRNEMKSPRRIAVLFSTKSFILLATSFVGALAAPTASSCQIKANVCLQPFGSGDCLPGPYVPKTCYDLPGEWIGKVRTLTPLDDDAVCLANLIPCSEATQNVCHPSVDCTGYVMLSKENTHGWDLSTTDFMDKVQSFSCWKNGTLPGAPAAVSVLAAPAPTVM
ncbi:hypothetical protein F5X99DRAFT_269181 [Biscogniauxia marginata]|nr:hypothetical protein F5X99DRAFT_269181 [Biscogniauxia marginata]